jgi:hypothetical protein
MTRAYLSSRELYSVGRFVVRSPHSWGVGSGCSGVRPGLMKTASITGSSRRSIRLSSTFGTLRSPSMFLNACPSLKIMRLAGTARSYWAGT